MREHRFIFLFLAAMAAVLPLACSPPETSGKAEPGRTIRVQRVIDGDTIVLADGQRLRYIGIDTPEEFDHRKPVQCYAREAAEANRKLVEGKEIVFSHDKTERDRYGRLLAFVYLMDGPRGTQGTFVNAKMVQDGYAFAYRYRPDTSKDKEFEADEEQARSRRLGLWSHCMVHRVSGGREQTNAISHGP